MSNNSRMDSMENSLDVEKATPPEPSTHAGTRSSQNASLHRLWRYWNELLEVDTFMVVQLLLLTFGTGIQDAISFPDFRCFASNQTGNTVVLTVALASGTTDLFDPANVGASLASFIGGAIVTGQLGNFFGRRRRLWQFLNNTAQTFMVFGAAWVQFSRSTEGKGPWPRTALALLACASGAQVAAAREMSVPEITTAMATAAWVDLVIDKRLMSWDNRSRNRRSLFLGSLVAGSFAGAFMRSRIGSPLAIVVSGIVKVVVAIFTLISSGSSQGRNADSTSRKSTNSG